MKNIVFKLIVPAVLLFAGCSNKKKEVQPPKTIQQIQSEKGVPVTTDKIGSGVIRRIERSKGTLQGVAEAVLANGMGGTLKKITVSVGNTVNKNDVVAIMEIDGGSPVDVAQSAFEYAQKAYDRAKKLQDKGAISKEQVDGARVQYEDAKRNLGQATVGVNVNAPFKGTVVEIYESEGSKIGAKTSLVKIADLSIMEVHMQVNEQAISFYKKGQKAFLLMGNDSLWGTIDRIALGANGMSHSFNVIARFSNHQRLLKPGLFKQIHTIVEEKNNTLYLPIEAVNFDQNNKPYIYSINNGMAVKKIISIGITNDYFYEIIQGCAANDQIIMSGLTLLQDGKKVNIVNK